MRDPLYMKTADDIQSDIIHINNLPMYEEKDYDLLDEKDSNKQIFDIEKACRTSFEYRQFIKFLKENLDMRKCAYYQSVNNYNTNKIKIEIHHDPFDLFTICQIVREKRICNNERLDVELIAKEVMLLHYNLLVGLIPLSETVHELVHNQYLFVPSTAVFGFYKDFMDMYDDYISEEIKEKVQRIEEASLNYDGSDKYILNQKFIYTDVSGAYKLPKYEDVKNFLTGRINDIDNGRPQENLNFKMYKKEDKVVAEYVPLPFRIKL